MCQVRSCLNFLQNHRYFTQNYPRKYSVFTSNWFLMLLRDRLEIYLVHLELFTKSLYMIFQVYHGEEKETARSQSMI